MLLIDSPVKKKDCRCCQGSGQEYDHKAVGETMRKIRLNAKLSQAALGKLMKITAAYICDLEKGYRNWNDDLIERYKKACAKK